MLKQVLILPILHISENNNIIKMLEESFLPTKILGGCFLQRVSIICQELKIEYDKNQLEQQVNSLLSPSMTFICIYSLSILLFTVIIIYTKRYFLVFILPFLFLILLIIGIAVAVKNFTDSYKLLIEHPQNEFPSFNPIASWIIWVTNTKLVKLIIIIIGILFLVGILLLGIAEMPKTFLFYSRDDTISNSDNDDLILCFFLRGGLNELSKMEAYFCKENILNDEKKSKLFEKITMSISTPLQRKYLECKNILQEYLVRCSEEKKEKIVEFMKFHVKESRIISTIFISFFFFLGVTFFYFYYYLYDLEKLITTIVKIEISFNDKNLDNKEIIKTILHNF